MNYYEIRMLLWQNNKLSWNKNVVVAKKVTSGKRPLKRIKNYVDGGTLISIYNALIRPDFDYCYEIWDNLGS